jgi:hypothetical protein
MDINSLTLGELASIEEAAGRPISDLADANAPKTRLMIELAYVIKKRQDPNFTRNQAEAMTMADLNGIVGATDASPEAPSA